MIVDINYITAAKKRIMQINCENLENLTFVKNGEEVEFGENQLAIFKRSGMSNLEILNRFIPTQVRKSELTDDQ